MHLAIALVISGRVFVMLTPAIITTRHLTMHEIEDSLKMIHTQGQRGRSHEQPKIRVGEIILEKIIH